ncbi:MAG: choice-of-anchor X domain-containing protein, partial [bacterium]
LVCCSSQEVVRARYGISNTVGNWSGRLQNDGETLKLINEYGREMDRVTYSDHGSWPVAADGLGPSLERVFTGAPATSSVNWASSEISTNWQHVVMTNQVSSANAGIRFFLDFEGKCRLDDVSIKAEGSSSELMVNGDFETGTNGWSFKGNHATSRAVPGAGRFGSKGLVISGTETRLFKDLERDILIANGDAVSNCVASLPLVTSDGLSYVMSYWLCRDGLAENVYAVADQITNVVSLSSQGTPGAANSVAGSLTPFGITSVSSLYAICPFGTSNVIRARVTASSIVANMGLFYRTADSNSYYFTDTAYTNVAMRDDGLPPDLVAGDGEYAALVPFVSSKPQLVRYHLRATGTNGFIAQVPLRDDPSCDFGYWIESNPGQTVLPNWRILVDGNPVTYPISKRACAVSPDGQVFTDIRVRHRGYPYALYPETTGISVR